MKIATSANWKYLPLPDALSTLSVHRIYTSDEMEKITSGLIPSVMEDKWFIYFANNLLYFHRSWTGVCRYVAHFETSGTEHAIVALDVNRDPSQYEGTDDAGDARMVFYLIDLLLLGKDLEFPNETASIAEAWGVAGRAYVNDDHKERVDELQAWAVETRKRADAVSNNSDQTS